MAHVRDAWNATLGEVSARSKRVWGLLNPSRPLRFDDDHLVIEVQSSFHESTMSEDANRGILGDALFGALGIRPSIGFVARGSAGEPVADTRPAEIQAPAPAAAQAPRSVPKRSSSPSSAPASAAEPAEEMVDISETKPVLGGEHDPVELVKKGLGAEVVEERTID